MDTLKNTSQGLGTPERRTEAVRQPSLRRANFEDYEQIAALQIRNGLASTCYQAWAALWIDNPAYHKWKADWPIGWVLQTGTDKVVGFLGNLPAEYQFRGHELRVSTPVSWVVDESYRSYSMLLLDRITRQKGVDLVILTTVGPKAEPGLKAFKFSKVPVGTWNESEFWITNYRGFSQSVLASESIPFSNVISYPISAILFCRDKLKQLFREVDRSTSDIETCSEFDSRFDQFWYSLAHQNPNILLARRTRETLAWHFRDAMLRHSACIVTASKGSDLTAYAVFQRQDKPEHGLKRVRLVDFQSLKGFEQMLLPFLSWIFRKCNDEGIDLLEIMGRWLARPDLPPVFAPYHRRLCSWSSYYRAINEELSEILKQSDIWAPSSFDGDASLW
ncbi:MAG: hypothetical protein DMG88_21705 [Acidobacteria bacterium]|nr:MAG: hypothetical protein DMG88_21705 [Acidobacteriota bacterium]